MNVSLTMKANEATATTHPSSSMYCYGVVWTVEDHVQHWKDRISFVSKVPNRTLHFGSSSSKAVVQQQDLQETLLLLDTMKGKHREMTSTTRSNKSLDVFVVTQQGSSPLVSPSSSSSSSSSPSGYGVKPPCQESDDEGTVATMDITVCSESSSEDDASSSSSSTMHHNHPPRRALHHDCYSYENRVTRRVNVTRRKEGEEDVKLASLPRALVPGISAVKQRIQHLEERISLYHVKSPSSPSIRGRSSATRPALPPKAFNIEPRQGSLPQHDSDDRHGKEVEHREIRRDNAVRDDKSLPAPPLAASHPPPQAVDPPRTDWSQDKVLAHEEEADLDVFLPSAVRTEEHREVLREAMARVEESHLVPPPPATPPSSSLPPLELLINSEIKGADNHDKAKVDDDSSVLTHWTARSQGPQSGSTTSSHCHQKNGSVVDTVSYDSWSQSVSSSLLSRYSLLNNNANPEALQAAKKRSQERQCRRNRAKLVRSLQKFGLTILMVMVLGRSSSSMDTAATATTTTSAFTFGRWGTQADVHVGDEARSYGFWDDGPDANSPLGFLGLFQFISLLGMLIYFQIFAESRRRE